jgi:signal transduction histidine kinase
MDNLKILIVEDELLLAANMEEILQENGHTVVQICPTVGKAALAFAKYSPDLVLLDIRLQGNESGIDLSERLRKYSSVPIVFVTANSDEKTLQSALKTNPYGYLIKPVNEKDLITTISIAINRHSVEQERLELENRVNSAARSIELGELTGSLIHDVINPLMSVQRSMKELKESLDISCEKVDQKLNYTMDLILKFRELSQGQEEESQQYDIRDLINSATLILNYVAKTKSVEIRVIDSNLKVHCQKMKMTRILVNLVKNAIDAVEKLSSRWVEIKAEETDEKTKIYITDSGEGLSDEAKKNLFVRFFTTKGTEKGTGIGLSSAKSLLNNMQGDLEYNAESKNTQFVVSLPKNK